MKDVYQVRDNEVVDNQVLTVNYTRPKLFHRVLANVIDFFVMLVLFLSLFIGVRAIVQNTPYYKKAQNRITQMQVQSGLYTDNVGNDVTGKYYDIIYYLDNYKQTYGTEFDGKGAPDEEGNPTDPVGKNGLAVQAINRFIDFCKENSPEARYVELLGYYDSYRLDPTLNGVHYFVKDGDNIVVNETLSSVTTNLPAYYNNIFKPFIEKRCIPFFSSNVTEYRQLTRMDYKFLLFLELPVAYCLAGILTYLVPPLFFRRGRQTLGKAIYHIGLIDTRLLSPTVPRFLARFAIFFFGELILSLFSLGIPYIISFSMMVFSKQKQGFPDYMLRLYEVDTSKANIYLDYVEAQLKNELHGKAIDFKMEKPL